MRTENPHPATLAWFAGFSFQSVSLSFKTKEKACTLSGLFALYKSLTVKPSGYFYSLPDSPLSRSHFSVATGKPIQIVFLKKKKKDSTVPTNAGHLSIDMIHNPLKFTNLQYNRLK
jgi:hypothetical protein